jgi:hypothetical protein
MTAAGTFGAGGNPAGRIWSAGGGRAPATTAAEERSTAGRRGAVASSLSAAFLNKQYHHFDLKQSISKKSTEKEGEKRRARAEGEARKIKSQN